MTEDEAMEIIKQKLIVEGDILYVASDAHLDRKVIEALGVLEQFLKDYAKSIGW